MSFSAEEELFSWTYGKPWGIKLLIFPVWNLILQVWDTLFELIEIEVQCSKSYFKISLSQEAGASGNNTEKEPQKPRPKFKEYIC